MTKKGVSAIAKQRTYTDADREQAFAEYTVLGNWELVSRKMGIPVNTLKSWWRRHPPDMDEYAKNGERSARVSSKRRVELLKTVQN